MSREATQFKEGNAGRPKGSVNRKVKVGTEYAQSYLKDPDFQDAVRLILANPTHDLFMRVFELVMAYAYGKPAEHLHQTSDGSLPTPQLQVAFVDYDKFFAADMTERVVSHDGGDSSPL